MKLFVNKNKIIETLIEDLALIKKYKKEADRLYEESVITISRLADEKEDLELINYDLGNQITLLGVKLKEKNKKDKVAKECKKPKK